MPPLVSVPRLQAEAKQSSCDQGAKVAHQLRYVTRWRVMSGLESVGVVEMDTEVICTLLIERGSRLTLLLSVVTPATHLIGEVAKMAIAKGLEHLVAAGRGVQGRFEGFGRPEMQHLKIHRLQSRTYLRLSKCSFCRHMTF
ncbi:hypothetical protein KC363_g51 [Hortaea werneckii]|nr:hypothetical protein KC363_g51 [Hortaea werneckii]